MVSEEIRKQLVELIVAAGSKSQTLDLNDEEVKKRLERWKMFEPHPSMTDEKALTIIQAIKKAWENNPKLSVNDILLIIGQHWHANGLVMEVHSTD